MPHDPELVAETREWLVRASQDLGAGERDFIDQPVSCPPGDLFSTGACATLVP